MKKTGASKSYAGSMAGSKAVSRSKSRSSEMTKLVADIENNNFLDIIPRGGGQRDEGQRDAAFPGLGRSGLGGSLGKSAPGGAGGWGLLRSALGKSLVRTAPGRPTAGESWSDVATKVVRGDGSLRGAKTAVSQASGRGFVRGGSSGGVLVTPTYQLERIMSSGSGAGDGSTDLGSRMSPGGAGDSVHMTRGGTADARPAPRGDTADGNDGKLIGSQLSPRRSSGGRSGIFAHGRNVMINAMPRSPAASMGENSAASMRSGDSGTAESSRGVRDGDARGSSKVGLREADEAILPALRVPFG